MLKLQEDVRKLKQEVSDQKYDIQGVRDSLESLEKTVQSNHRELTNHDDMQVKRIEALENSLNSLKKTISEQSKRTERAKNIGGGGGVDGSVIADLEDDINKLRNDLEAHKTETAKQLRQVDNVLEQKASKTDLDDLEQRLMDKLQELLNNLSNMFAEKDQMRKKFLSLEKNVSLRHPFD